MKRSPAHKEGSKMARSSSATWRKTPRFPVTTVVNRIRLEATDAGKECVSCRLHGRRTRMLQNYTDVYCPRCDHKS